MKSNPLAKPQKMTHMAMMVKMTQMAMMVNYEKVRNLRWPCGHHYMTRNFAEHERKEHG